MVDYDDIHERNGDGEEVQNARVSRKVTLRMGRSLHAYLAYYSERFEGDSSLADPEAICLAKEDSNAVLFTVPAGCENEYSVGECIEAGERLADKLLIGLDEPGISAIIAAYLEDQIDGVVRAFCKGDKMVRNAACEFLEKLHICLSRQESRDCWPEVSEKAEKKFLMTCRHRLTPLQRRFGIYLCGEARLNRLFAA